MLHFFFFSYFKVNPWRPVRATNGICLLVAQLTSHRLLWILYFYGHFNYYDCARCLLEGFFLFPAICCSVTAGIDGCTMLIDTLVVDELAILLYEPRASLSNGLNWLWHSTAASLYINQSSGLMGKLTALYWINLVHGEHNSSHIHTHTEYTSARTSNCVYIRLLNSIMLFLRCKICFILLLFKIYMFNTWSWNRSHRTQYYYLFKGNANFEYFFEAAV